MLIKTGRDGYHHPIASEITPQAVYQRRRELLKLMAGGAAGAALAGWASREALAAVQRPDKLAPLPAQPSKVAGAMTMEKPTSYEDTTSYNNFYEFGTDKADPVRNAHTLRTSPWTVEVDGLVKKPARYALEDLLKLAPQEERIYRLRCVEGWSSAWSRSGRPSSSSSTRWPTAPPCPASAPACWTGPTWRGCAWTKPCTR